jgi:hypothetical protein
MKVQKKKTSIAKVVMRSKQNQTSKTNRGMLANRFLNNALQTRAGIIPQPLVYVEPHRGVHHADKL